MIQLFKMALRDLLRNRRRSFFSSLALGMGLALLLLMASVVTGEMRDALNASIKLSSGHLQVRAATYDENKTSLAWKDLIENPEAVAAQMSGLEPVKAATPRLFASGIIASGNESTGVRILGIDPPSPANDPFRDGMLAGSFLAADDREGILIGRPLADKLALQENDSVSLLVNTSDGTVDEQRFTIRGIYSTRTPAFDNATVFMPLAKAQTITHAENHASIIFVLLKANEQTGAVKTALQTSQHQVVSYLDMNELLIETEKMSKAYMILLYLIVLGITASVIVNTLIMSVFERTREIGILSAIGMKPWRIMVMFFIESVLLAIGGIIIGLILGGLLVYYAATVGFYIGNMGMSGIMLGERIYAYLTVKDTVSLSVIALIVTLLAALYPALLAARMEPVTALRGGK